MTPPKITPELLDHLEFVAKRDEWIASEHVLVLVGEVRRLESIRADAVIRLDERRKMIDEAEQERDQLRAELKRWHETGLVTAEAHEKVRARVERLEGALREIVSTEEWAGLACGRCLEVKNRAYDLVQIARRALRRDEETK